MFKKIGRGSYYPAGELEARLAEEGIEIKPLLTPHEGYAELYDKIYTSHQPTFHWIIERLKKGAGTIDKKELLEKFEELGENKVSNALYLLQKQNLLAKVYPGLFEPAGELRARLENEGLTLPKGGIISKLDYTPVLEKVPISHRQTLIALINKFREGYHEIEKNELDVDMGSSTLQDHLANLKRKGIVKSTLIGIYSPDGLLKKLIDKEREMGEIPKTTFKIDEEVANLFKRFLLG